MLPHFPEFKNIEWTDRHIVEQFTKNFPPYSDYNFVSLWSWDTRDKMKLSVLHGNLVLLFYDYMTEKPFLSFIGANMVSCTAQTLMEYSLIHFQEPCLKLIPEAVAALLCNEQFVLVPDEDSHDYILSVPYLCSIKNLSGDSDLAARGLRKYLKKYPHHKILTFSGGDIPADDCIELFKNWAKVKCLDHCELNEYSAFVRFITKAENDNIILGVYDDGVMIGFAAYEIVSSEYAIGHFLKADSSYKGIYEALNHFVGCQLAAKDILYWNFEQDLGIPQLRQSKKKYKPVFYLKKFIVQKREP